MPKISLRQALEIGLKKHQSDHLREAEEIYRQVLRHDPQNTDALHFLGVLKHQQGDNDAAVEMLEASVRSDGNVAAAHHNLGLVLARLNRHDAAIGAHRRALELEPNHAEAWNNLGASLRAIGEVDAAHAACSKAVEINPKFAQAYSHLGAVLSDQNRLDEAIACWRKAIALEPKLSEAHRNCAAALIRQEKYAEALAHAEKAYQLDSRSPEARKNLAAARHHRAVELHGQGRITAAIELWREVIELDPDHASAHNDLANALASAGRADESLKHYHRAIEIEPKNASAHSNLLLAMNYLPQFDGAAAMFEAHRQWERQQVGLTQAHAGPSEGFGAPRDGGILRIGYVSPDFRQHPVGRFVEPLIAGHDRSRFHVTCYSAAPDPDELTRHFESICDCWREINAMNDDEAVEQIRRDGIDVLVDLAGHTGHNRLKVFARRAAPVQVAWCGYPNTTGLTSMDFRITDEHCDPPGMTEAYHTEELTRLPGPFLCYAPGEQAPDVAPSPMAQNGFVTFGSFNNLAKLTPAMIDLWATILREAGDRSRLVLKAKALADAPTRQRLIEQFVERGIAAARIEALPPTRGIAEHLAAYHNVDVALDTFPYHGTTTTFEALWMGVPVITLRGNTHASRVGASILTYLNHPEWIAASPEEYVQAATRLADANVLPGIRANLREQLRQSPLADRARFVANVEQAFEQMWRRRCSVRSDEPQIIRF